MLPLVSIVIPCFNAQAFVGDAVRSALAQTYPSREVIVINDGSTDRSLEILSGFGHQIKVIEQSNRGLSAARNRGIEEARGEWLAFLDADDWWDPRFLERSLEALQSGAVLSYCGWQNKGLPGQRGQPFVPPDYQSDPNKLTALVEGPKWPVHAAVIKRDIVERTGGFDESLSCCEDFALWLRIATNAPIIRIPEVLAYYRFHPRQMTRNRARLAITHYQVQLAFLKEHPEVRATIGHDMLKRITAGTLMYRGFEAYWGGDLVTARSIFRVVMRSGYGGAREWVHMLPSVLPHRLHRILRMFGNCIAPKYPRSNGKVQPKD